MSLAVLATAVGGAGANEPRRELRGRYLDILTFHASAGIDRALPALVGLESGVEGGADSLDPQSLRRVVLQVGEELALSGPSLLLPVIELHRRSYLVHRDRQAWRAAHHARATVFLLCDLYARSADGVQRRETASDLFASLAGYFHQESTNRTAIELYRRALALDSDHEEALLGLATAYEQQGRHPQALPVLERLVAAHPGNLEARLRLAIQWARARRWSEAVEGLELLTRQPGPDWVVNLAFQELARIRMKQGALEVARQLLVRALERFPRDWNLLIGQAYLDDRLGLRPAGPGLLQVLTACARDCEPSTRYRYAKPRLEPMAEVRSRLADQAARMLPALAATLSSGRLGSFD